MGRVMIERDPEAAARLGYDLIIVGGGAYGIALALEAARRGLRPLLIERRDFGGATSWNSLRIVHGGLRYLQTLDLHRFRESVRERRWLLQHFPEQVYPLPCLMPLYGHGLRRPSVFRFALMANELLSRDRNGGVRADRALPASRVLSDRQTVQIFSQVNPAGLLGAAYWYDAAMPDSQRLLIEMLHWAVACGAVALNYLQGRQLVVRQQKVVGVQALDVHSGQILEFRSAVVVNCTGPWCREVAATFDRDIPELFHLSIAFNLLIDRRQLCDAALAVAPPVAEARTYFLHPWKGKILAGTYHAPWRGTREAGRVDRVLIDRFVDDLNQTIPGFGLGADEVLRVHWGFLPAKAPGGDGLAVREVLCHHADRGGPEGLFSVSGVKFTTARCVAQKTLRVIQRWRGASTPSYHGPGRPTPTPGLALDAFKVLLRRDRKRAAQHVRKMVEDESVLHLDDLLLRRTDWGMDPRDEKYLSGELAGLLGWEQDRGVQELTALR